MAAAISYMIAVAAVLVLVQVASVRGNIKIIMGNYTVMSYYSEVKSIAKKSGDCQIVQRECDKLLDEFEGKLDEEFEKSKRVSCCEITTANMTIAPDCRLVYGVKEEVDRYGPDCSWWTKMDKPKYKNFRKELESLARGSGDCGKVKAKCTELQMELVKKLPEVANKSKSGNCCVNNKVWGILFDCPILYGGTEQIKQDKNLKAVCDEYPQPPVKGANKMTVSLAGLAVVIGAVYSIF